MRIGDHSWKKVTRELITLLSLLLRENITYGLTTFLHCKELLHDSQGFKAQQLSCQLTTITLIRIVTKKCFNHIIAHRATLP